MSDMPADIMSKAISCADAVSFGGYEHNALLVAAALRGERDRDRWLPIETAPKDGTVVDLWNDQFNRRQVNCQWRLGADVDPENCGEGGIWRHLRMDGWRYIGDTNGCGCLTAAQFSHWMPLPSPPSKAKQVEKDQ